MGALATVRSQLSARNRALSDLRSPERAAMDGAIVLGGAFAAGALDKYFEGGLAGVPASTAAGLATAAAGWMAGSPAAIKAATGLLAGAAYDAGVQAVEYISEE